MLQSCASKGVEKKKKKKSGPGASSCPHHHPLTARGVPPLVVLKPGISQLVIVSVIAGEFPQPFKSIFDSSSPDPSSWPYLSFLFFIFYFFQGRLKPQGGGSRKVLGCCHLSLTCVRDAQGCDVWSTRKGSHSL